MTTEYSQELLRKKLQELEEEHSFYEGRLCTCEDDGSYASKLNTLGLIIDVIEKHIKLSGGQG